MCAMPLFFIDCQGSSANMSWPCIKIENYNIGLPFPGNLICPASIPGFHFYLSYAVFGKKYCQIILTRKIDY